MPLFNPATITPAIPRKRTSSFSEPVQRKTSRTMLRRTESFLSLSDYNDDDEQSESGSFLHMTPPHVVPYNRTLLHYKEQRERRKLGRTRPEFTIAPPPNKPLPKPTTRSLSMASTPASVVVKLRTTSPLAPTRQLLPPRPSFPRSKPEPDLYRQAIKANMRSSPDGRNILRMGPHLAVSILSATRELERIVSAHEDEDVAMADDNQGVPWVLMRGQDMVIDCRA
ncbi:hypothetical protein F5I97DRAFT_1459366 [Phlebopus sp. FC_14]|nr:hypothetical protein F5I97DRAFT_1459366 [Phlebopus sp. FC_14]